MNKFKQNSPFGLRPVGPLNENGIGHYDMITNVSYYKNDPVVFMSAAADMAAFKITPHSGAVDATAPLVGVFHGCSYTDMDGNYVEQDYWIADTAHQGDVIAKVVDDPNMIFEVQVSVHEDAANNIFVNAPSLPNLNANAAAKKGGIGSNFALMKGGGENFNTIGEQYGVAVEAGNPTRGYKNNPADGSKDMGSAFYLTAKNGENDAADYSKVTETLPLKLISQVDMNFTSFSGNNAAENEVLNNAYDVFFPVVRVKINHHVFSQGTVGTTFA